MNKHIQYNHQQGLIKMIILIVIAIVILSYYGVDLKKVFTSPQVQKNLGYVWNFITMLWNDYLAAPATFVWGIILNLFKK